MQRLLCLSEILLPDVVAGCLIPRDFATAAQQAYIALGIYEGITHDYCETECEMWNQYWWVKGIGQLGEHLHLKDFVSIRKPTREEVQCFQEEWKWEMVHTTDWDPYKPVQVNKDGETLDLPNVAWERNLKSTQDQVIAQSLSTIGPPSVLMGRFQDCSTKPPPGIVNKPELESMDDAEEDSRPLESRYSPKRFEAAFCLWYMKLNPHCQEDLFTYGPRNLDPMYEEDTRTVSYIARGVTEHLKYELGLKSDEQWIVMKWIQTFLDWEMFCDARQVASVTIGHEELHEMTKRAVLTVPMADPWKPCPMTIEGLIVIEGTSEPTPRSSPTGSDSLSTLSSCLVTPPSITEEKKPGQDTATRNPRKQMAAA